MRLAATAALVALAISGCGDSDEAGVDVVGVWSVSGAGVEAEVTYRPDGTYRIAPVVGGVPLVNFDFGTYETDGSTLTFESTGDPGGCIAGDVGTYSIEVLAGGSWRLDAVEDDCAQRLEGNPFTHDPRAGG